MTIPALTCRPAPATGAKPRILLVDDEPALVDVVRDVVGREIDCELTIASTLAEARRILAGGPFELLIADLNLPDGDGMLLLEALRLAQPLASAVIITGAPTIERAIGAIRGGALNFLPKPFSASDLVAHLRQALAHQAQNARDSRRLVKLREAVKRLNDARKIVSKKVDLLCNDLIGAYSELARQLDVVRIQEGFRKSVAESRDLEQLLCNAMDWILRQLGYCNIAIWLAANENDFQLGAYMKYTIGGEPGLVSAMKTGLVRQVNEQGALYLSGEQVQQKLTERELDYLGDQNIAGANCTYLAEALASVIVFRDANKPFTEDDVETLKAISPIFAVALASMVRGPQKYPTDDSPFCDENPTPTEPDDEPDDRDSRRRAHDSDDAPGSGNWRPGGSSPRPPRSRKNDADWWKRGEPPPF